MKRLITASEQAINEATQALDIYVDNPNDVNDKTLKNKMFNVIKQEFDSKETSRPQTPELFHEILNRGGFIGNNYDNGGGRYDIATEWYKENTQWLNYVYDKFNRSEEHNNEVNNRTDYATSTIANVLNVVKEDSIIEDILQNSKDKAPITYISVYEGNKSGIGKMTLNKKDGSRSWQRNQCLYEYLPFVNKIFGKGNYSLKGSVITAWNPDKLSDEKIQELSGKIYNNKKHLDTKLKQLNITANLKTLKGSPIKRYHNNVGKEIGGKIYVHKDYANEIVPSNILTKAQNILDINYSNFNYNCICYDTRNNIVVFDEAPDFDIVREPHVGDYVKVNVEDETATKGHSNNIWHHKWLWVKDDYQGFDVEESKNWSAKWLGIIPETAKGTDKTWNKQLQDNGLE